MSAFVQRPTKIGSDGRPGAQAYPWKATEQGKGVKEWGEEAETARVLTVSLSSRRYPHRYLVTENSAV
jgi:hypothetical protein